jgi:glycosyltransferase involved in cell wall biosynthesis
MGTVNVFYEEPDPDRWIRFDRYPRRVARRVIRGRPPIGGVQRLFLNLRAGLERLGVAFRVNDYRHALRRPDEAVGIIGKPQVLDAQRWENPILFGPGLYSHPCEDPDLVKRLPVRRILVGCEWMQKMFESYYGDVIKIWPAGIETDLWHPAPSASKDVDVLVYDKVRWERDRYGPQLISPILESVARRGLRVVTLRYGAYREEDYRALLGRSRSMIFLCEHETQGFAYLQALSSGVPILAWDRGGPWRDPAHYPHRVQFEPVTSVPYWDERCGMKFANNSDFAECLDRFLDGLRRGKFDPRAYVVATLSLEECAQRYLDHLASMPGA